MALSSAVTGGVSGEATPGFRKNRNSAARGVTGLGMGESNRRGWLGEFLKIPVGPSLISSFRIVCRRSWSLNGDRRGPVWWSVAGGKGFEEESLERWVTGSFSEWPEKPVSFWTRSLKEFGSAWTKVVGEVDGGGEEMVVRCFSIGEREREREGVECFWAFGNYFLTSEDDLYNGTYKLASCTVSFF